MGEDSLALIGFGFGIDRIVEAIAGAGRTGTWLTPFVTLSFIALGVYGLAAASHTYVHELKALESQRYEFKPEPPHALILSTILAAVGAVAFFGLLVRAIAFK